MAEDARRKLFDYIDLYRSSGSKYQKVVILDAVPVGPCEPHVSAKKRRRMRRATPRLILRFVEERARAAVSRETCYWIANVSNFDWSDVHCDAATNFCAYCVEKKVNKIWERFPDKAELNEVRIDGGWVTAHDSPPECDTCGVKLDGSLTDHGAEEELDALTTYAKPDEPEGWDALLLALMNLQCGDASIYEAKNHDPGVLATWRKVAKLVRRGRKAMARRS